MKILFEGKYNIRDIGSMNPDIDPNPEMVIDNIIRELNSKGIYHINRGNNSSEVYDDFIMELVFNNNKEMTNLSDFIKQLSFLDKIGKKYDVEFVMIQHGNGIRFDLF